MNRLIRLLLSLSIVLALAGCGSTPAESEISNADTVTSASSTSTSSSKGAPADTSNPGTPEVTPSPNAPTNTDTGSAPTPAPDTLFDTDGIPTPEATVQALLNCQLKEDYTLLQTLFGYESVQAVNDDLFDGKSVREVVADSGTAAFGDISVDEEAYELFIGAYFDAIGRSTISCKTVAIEPDTNMAVVAVTVNAYSLETFQTDLAAAFQKALAENPDLANDEQAQTALIIREMAKCLNALTPSAQTVTIDVACTLQNDTYNGKNRSVWLPTDQYTLGEEIASAILPL